MRNRIASAGLTAAAFLLVQIAAPLPALAWGAMGHHLVNRLAAESLPTSVPAFMRTPFARSELTDLGLELDLLKGAGTEWDAELDPGHYLDIADNGSIQGGLSLRTLPSTREAYDTALRARGTDQYKTGYLPYSIVQGWEQLRMVFAYWRVDSYETVHAKTASLRATAAFREKVDEQIARRDAGVWGHYVADASQPLHVTVHFNGWGAYPNPHGYSTSSHLHDLFETQFVDRFITRALVAKRMTPMPSLSTQTLTSQNRLMAAVAQYLQKSSATVPHLYQIAKTGGFNTGSPQAKVFVEQRLAFGASELRTLIVWAWDDSLNETIGDDVPQRVRDIVSGRAPYAGLR